MKQTLSKFGVSCCLTAVVCLMAAVGCDDSTKHAAQVRPQEIKPQPEQAAPPATRAVLTPLPLPQRPVNLIEPPPPSAVDAILSYAMWAFEAGQQDFRAGHLTKARQDFDLALDTLIGSGLDVKSDPRVLAAYQHIVETVSSEEFAAFREGDGFSELKAAVAPIDQIPEIGVPAPGSLDPKLAATAERELAILPHDFPLTVNEYVLVYLNFFQTPRGRAIVETGLRRAGRYRSMIEQVLDNEGLPHDLIYMAQAESAFQPTAVSKARAVGLWQFMSGRAREYGLQHTWWIDERQDPVKSTRAAARHLHDLYDLFGDWYLAMAAYDSGPGNVQKAIERTGYADFWELYKRNVLPKETRNYVPIILALTLIAKDPGRYGIELTPEAVQTTDSVKPGRPIDLRLVAETIDVDVQQLRALNPELLRMVTPNDPSYELRLPAGTAGRFLAEIANVPQEKWVSWRMHRIEEGETLSEVARIFRVAPAAIADANGLDSRAAIQAGQKLVIPAVTGQDLALGKLTYYRVRKGDTVSGIAEEYSVTAEELVKWNHLAAGRISRGMRLRVYPGGMGANSHSTPSRPSPQVTPTLVASGAPAPATSPAAAVMHKVEPGETLWSIAKAYRTTAEALRAANKFLFTRPLQVGDQLMIIPPH